jgi:folate-dependent phosphoribosylglycinamide formyltransferase PurN
LNTPTEARPATDSEFPAGEGLVVLLAGPGYSTDIVANFLASRVPNLVVVLEDSPSHVQMARRRARRLGWLSVAGQIVFVSALQPFLRRQGARRRIAILRAASLDPSSHRAPLHRVSSVNDQTTVSLLTSLRPTAVVVHGTRIIAARVLNSLECPVLNMHAGITPRYRGVHGGYWALVERHPEWVGTTVHLVDPGIDTGGILAQTTFGVTEEDTIATYPDLHLAHGLPLLETQLKRVLAGEDLEPAPTGIAPGSQLYHHPTLWGYLRHRWGQGVR